MICFSPSEFRCRCGCGAGIERMDGACLAMLEEARRLAGIPFVLSSAFRCPEHNRAVGGVEDSAHTRGHAGGHPLRVFSRTLRHAGRPYRSRIPAHRAGPRLDSRGQRPGQAARCGLLSARRQLLMETSVIDFLFATLDQLVALYPGAGWISIAAGVCSPCADSAPWPPSGCPRPPKPPASMP